MHYEAVYRVEAPSEMVCSERRGLRRAASTLSWSKNCLLPSLRYKKKGSMRVYFTVASYLLIDDFTSMTCVAGTALKLYHTGELVLSCARGQ